MTISLQCCGGFQLIDPQQFDCNFITQKLFTDMATILFYEFHYVSFIHFPLSLSGRITSPLLQPFTTTTQAINRLRRGPLSVFGDNSDRPLHPSLARGHPVPLLQKAQSLIKVLDSIYQSFNSHYCIKPPNDTVSNLITQWHSIYYYYYQTPFYNYFRVN